MSKDATVTRPLRVPSGAQLPTAVTALVRVADHASADLAAWFSEQLLIRTRRNREASKLPHSYTRFMVAAHQHSLPVYEWGDARDPRVLLVHGWNGSAASFQAIIPELVAAGYHVTAFDNVGHGAAANRLVTPLDLATGVELVAARRGGALHAVVAHSMGSLATMIAATRGLRARCLVFFAPTNQPSVLVSTYAQLVSLSSESTHRLIERLERRLGCPLRDLNSHALAQRIDIPLRILQDKDDRATIGWETRRLARAWRGADLVFTQGLGHHRILKEPAALASATHFLDSYRPKLGSLRGISDAQATR